MSYYQENRPSMGGLADALAMQGRRGDSTLVHMNPMEVRMLEAMSPDGRLSINPETGLPEAFKLRDIAAIALPIAAGAFLGPAAAGLLGSSALTGTAVATGLGGVGAGLLQGKGVGDSLIQGGLSGLMSYGLGSLSGAFAPSGGVTAGPPTQATMAASGPRLMATAPDTVGAVTTAAAPEPTGFFGGLGETLRQTPFTDVPSVGSPTYGSMLGSGASGLLSSSLLAPEEMPYDIAGMDDMDDYYSRVPDLEAGRRRGRAAARRLQSPPSFLTSGGLYERAISPGGGGTFFAAEGGSVPGVFANVPPHVAEGIKQNPEIVNDATAFNNLVNTQPSTTDLMMGGGLSGLFLGNYPPHIARAIIQNPEIVNDATAVKNLLNTQPSIKDLIGSSSFFKGLPPHVARGVMQNPEVLTDATAFSNLVTGKASDIQTNQTSNLDAGRLRGQAAARSLNYPSSGITGSQYYGMATSPGGFGTFFAADGGQVPNPYGNPYGPGDPYGGMSDESNSGQSSGTGQSADVGPGMSLGSFNEPVADIGLGSFNPTPMSLGLTALGMMPGPIGMVANIANIGRGLIGLMGPSVPGQVTGFGTTQGGPTGIGIGVTGQAVDPDAEAVAGLADVVSAAVEDFGVAHAGEVGGPAGPSDGEPGSGTGPGEAGAAASAGMGMMAQGGVVDFYAQGGGISSLAYGGEAAPVGFANKAFEGMVPGPGTGMSDDVPFSIEGNQPALLSRDEYVLPADVVSQLGDGSSSAGADMLDNFISQVRQTKYGNTQQPAPVGPQLMTGLMKQGGVV